MVIRMAAAALLLALLGVAACGDDEPPAAADGGPPGKPTREWKPLDSVERAALGTYALDLVTHVPRDPKPLRSMRLVLRDDRSFSWTEWSSVMNMDVTTTGSWRIKEGKLIRVTTGYHAPEDRDWPAMDVPEPQTDEWIHENGTFRIWPHRPYRLLRVE